METIGKIAALCLVGGLGYRLTGLRTILALLDQMAQAGGLTEDLLEPLV